jgi:hypothetical protein
MFWTLHVSDDTLLYCIPMNDQQRCGSGSASGSALIWAARYGPDPGVKITRKVRVQFSISITLINKSNFLDEKLKNLKKKKQAQDPDPDPNICENDESVSALIYSVTLIIDLLVACSTKAVRNRILRKIHRPSVADPGCLSRIPAPDFHPFRIPDPTTTPKEERENFLPNFFVLPFFEATNIIKL